jgi:hypothetical protein
MEELTMTEHENIKLIKEHFAAFGRGVADIYIT